MDEPLFFHLEDLVAVHAAHVRRDRTFKFVLRAHPDDLPMALVDWRIACDEYVEARLHESRLFAELQQQRVAA